MSLQAILTSAGYATKNESARGISSQVIEVQLSPRSTTQPGELEIIQTGLFNAGKNIPLTSTSAKIYRVFLTLLSNYGSQGMQRWAKFELIMLGESELRALYYAHSGELDATRRGDRENGQLCRFRYILNT